MTRICNHLWLARWKPPNPSTERRGLSTFRNFTVSALGKLDSWGHAVFCLLGLSADDKEPAIWPSQSNSSTERTRGEWYIAHRYHLEPPSSEGVVTGLSQIYMPSGHGIILIKSSLDTSSITVRLSTRALKNALQAVNPAWRARYDERSEKSLPKRGHKTANHGPGLVLISTISLLVVTCHLRLDQILPSVLWGLRWHLQQKIHVPMPKKIIRSCTMWHRLSTQTLWRGCNGVWQIWAVRVRSPTPSISWTRLSYWLTWLFLHTIFSRNLANIGGWFRFSIPAATLTQRSALL